MKPRLWWLLAGLLLVPAACSSSSTCDPSSSLVYVDLPEGTDSISSFTVTGACATAVGGCVPVAASCETAGCECRFTLQVNPATFDASPNGICDIDVISKTGGEFIKDLEYKSNGGSCFAVSGPVGITIVALFRGPFQIDAGSTDTAGGPDAHASGPGADGGTDSAASGPDAGAGGTDAGAGDSG